MLETWQEKHLARVVPVDATTSKAFIFLLIQALITRPLGNSWQLFMADYLPSGRTRVTRESGETHSRKHSGAYKDMMHLGVRSNVEAQ